MCQRRQYSLGLAAENGEPAPGVEPMSCHISFEATDAGTRMTVVNRFTDVEQMQQLLGGGMQEGMTLAIGQIDGLLAPAPV